MSRRVMGLTKHFSHFVLLAIGAGGNAMAGGWDKAQGIDETRYVVKFLNSSGSASRGQSINDRGWVAGYTVTLDQTVRHVTLWKGNDPTYLGAIEDLGANSSVPWDGLNNRGMVAGISQTAMPEPLGEDWSCSAFFPAGLNTGRICVGFLWQRGVIQALPTFSGGHNGFATGINNSGQVVGWAENGVQDASCNDPQKLQFRAALWESKGRSMSITELSPLGADETSAATAINERGNVVGISGECDVAVGNLSAKHSVLWQKGKAVQIPDFGGIAWNTPMAVNIKNEVVGFANKAGTTTSDYDAVAFYWSKSAGLVEIGILPGDTNSQAHGINSEGVTVGVSFGGAIGSRAFVWRRGGEITDLNTLVVGGEPGVLVDARDINERGEITGGARDASGKSVAFIARPVFEEED